MVVDAECNENRVWFTFIFKIVVGGKIIQLTPPLRQKATK